MSYAKLKGVWRSLNSWLWSLADAFPPYLNVEGIVETKETSPEGWYMILVGSVRVSVDRATFDVLVVGENVRVRYTRGHRAINIDRILRGRGPG